jgi:hypothetical protein
MTMLQKLEIGGGQVDQTGEHLRLVLPPNGRHYADAQVDDYRGAGRRHFLNSAPLRMSLRARASQAAPAGTLGFGFWNDPFSLSGGVLAGPNVVWFFYASPPSDMALAEGVPGRGWKAATLNTGRLPPFILAPAALAAILLTRVPRLGRPIMAAARRAVQAHEAALNDVPLTKWHSYEIEWQPAEAVFRVDGVERLRSPAPPRGPLGLVIWIDNQYAVASREGNFGFGVCPVAEEQWLEVEGLQVKPGG